jgi:hypothetical protein
MRACYGRASHGRTSHDVHLTGVPLISVPLPPLLAASHHYLPPPITTCCLPSLPAPSHHYLPPPITTCCLPPLPATSHDCLVATEILQILRSYFYPTTLISGTRGVKKRRQRAPKTAPLAPRGPRDREPLFLGLCSQMPQILLPSPPPTLSFTTFAGPKYRKPKWVPTTYAPGLSKTAACAAYCTDCFNYKYGPPSYFLLASSLL